MQTFIEGNFGISLVYLYRTVNGERKRNLKIYLKIFSPLPVPENSTEPQGIERGRTLTRISSVAKYGGAGANFRGRKSNSLMNLCGGKQPY